MSDDTEEKVEGEVVEEIISTEPTDVPVEVEGAIPDPEAE